MPNSEQHQPSVQWGTPEVLTLFEDAAQKQVQSQLFAIWKQSMLAVGQHAPAHQYSETDRQQLAADIYAELPLAATKVALFRPGEPDEYMLGLVKVDPHTGETLRNTWAYVAEAAQNGEYVERHTQYTAEQVAHVLRQAEAQEQLGIHLTE